jgi:hypothetical protein
MIWFAQDSNDRRPLHSENQYGPQYSHVTVFDGGFYPT